MAPWRQGPGSESHHPELFHVYILRSRITGRYYVGSTEAVERRIREHNSGKSASTRSGVPWELVHTVSFPTRSEAVACERRVKARGIQRYLGDSGVLPA